MIEQPPLREFNAEEAEVLSAFLTGTQLGFGMLVATDSVLQWGDRVVAVRAQGGLIVNETFLLRAEDHDHRLVETLEALARLCGKTVTQRPVRLRVESPALAPRRRETSLRAAA